jgi:hypothetical protein
MSKRSRFVLIAVIVLVVAAAVWIGGGALVRFVRVMHGGH